MPHRDLTGPEHESAPTRQSDAERKDPSVIRLKITQEAMDAANRIAEERGMSQINVLSRLITFMGTVAPRDLQAIALGQLSPKMTRVALLELLKELKDDEDLDIPKTKHSSKSK